MGSTVTGLSLELVDLFQDFDRDQNGVVLKVEERVRVMEQNVRIENVRFGTARSHGNPLR
jgi:hypothetical protein